MRGGIMNKFVRFFVLLVAYLIGSAGIKGLNTVAAANKYILRFFANSTDDEGIFNCSALTTGSCSAPIDCMAATASSRVSGIYAIAVPSSCSKTMVVYCDSVFKGGGFIVIQRRRNGLVDFNRNYHNYKYGFGAIDGDYWIGLEKMHLLTNMARHELCIVMVDIFENSYLATYDHFIVGTESESYVIKKVGKFQGNVNDTLKYHVDMKFSTYDKDVDTSRYRKCAVRFRSGWWFRNCFKANLNGVYGTRASQTNGIAWNNEPRNLKLKYVCMMIRRRD